MKKILLASVATILSSTVMADSHKKFHDLTGVEKPSLHTTQKHYPMNKQEREVKALSTLKFDEADAYLERLERQKQRVEAFVALKNGIYDYEYANYLHVYSPTTRSQIILPADIADLKIKRITSEPYKTAASLEGRKDRLSVYMLQHDQARHLFGLYRQRIAAWHGGKPELKVTIQQAADREALFKFLDVELVSNAVTADMLKYFEHRLSVKDFDLLKKWIEAHKHHASKAKVIDILAHGATQNKISAYTHSVFKRVN